MVLEIVNADGTNVPNGITPTVNLPENYGDLGILGDRSDPLLDRTIVLITTGSRNAISNRTPFNMDEISNSQINNPTRNNMYSDIKQ